MERLSFSGINEKPCYVIVLVHAPIVTLLIPAGGKIQAMLLTLHAERVLDG